MGDKDSGLTKKKSLQYPISRRELVCYYKVVLVPAAEVDARVWTLIEGITTEEIADRGPELGSLCS